MGTAPSQAPRKAPSKPPKHSSRGALKLARVSQVEGSTPWTYMSGNRLSSDKWAAQRKVCETWVSRGAPKRIMTAWRKAASIKERRADRRAV